MQKNNKIRFKQAPLPFQGQKRKFLVEGNSLCDAIEALPDDTIFVDLFGGSGLLSRAAKDIKPNCRVIYNDFDNYSDRLANVDHTNALLAEIRCLLACVPKGKIVSPELKAKVLEVVARYESGGYVDYITLSSSILFSTHYVTNYTKLAKEMFYNRVRINDVPQNQDYLNDLDVRHCDYRVLFDEFKDNTNAFFFCDPPYLSTDATMYESYWSLNQYLDVLTCLQGVKFAFFTSNKSSLVALLDWFEFNCGYKTPFSDARKIEIESTLTHNAKYIDMMLLKTI